MLAFTQEWVLPYVKKKTPSLPRTPIRTVRWPLCVPLKAMKMVVCARGGASEHGEGNEDVDLSRLTRDGAVALADGRS